MASFLQEMPPPPKLKLKRQEAITLDEINNAFSGHKMKHVFTNSETSSSAFVDEGAKRAFENWNGTVFDKTTIKYHGECSLVKFDSTPFSSIEDIIDKALFYQRYDTKSDTAKRAVLIEEGSKQKALGQTPTFIPLSHSETMSDTVTKQIVLGKEKEGLTQDKEKEGSATKVVTTHSYMWVLREKPDKAKMKKKQYKNAVKMQEALAQYIRRMINYGIRSGSRTVELVGKKSQGAVGFVDDFVLIDHEIETMPKYILGRQDVEEECRQAYNQIIHTSEMSGKIDAIHDFFGRAAIEGFVLEDPLTTTKYKLRADAVEAFKKNGPHDFVNKVWRNKKMTNEEKYAYIKKQGNFWILLPQFYGM